MDKAKKNKSSDAVFSGSRLPFENFHFAGQTLCVRHRSNLRIATTLDFILNFTVMEHLRCINKLK